MSGVKITDLPAAPSAQLTDVFPVDQLPGPVTYKESNAQLLSLFQSNMVASITGTANQVIVSSPTGAVTLSLPQSIATTSNVQFNSVKLANAGILDSNGNTILALNPAASSVNYFTIQNGGFSGPPTFISTGADTNIDMFFLTKGTGKITFDAANTTIPFQINSGTALQHTTNFVIPNTAVTRTVTYQDASGTLAYVGDIPAGVVTSVSGTSNRITSTGGTTPVIDISASYVGQSSITTLGTIGTGTWQGTVIGGTYGGTGVNNGASTVTLGGSLTTSGAFASTFTMTGITNVTFPTSGTLSTTVGTVTSVSGTTNRITSSGGATPVIDISASYVGQSSITTLGTIGTGVWQGTVVGLTYGGTAAALTASNGGIVYSTAGALAILAGTATAGQMLQSGASTTPAWSTSTYPATNAINTLLYASSANVMAALATANSSVLVTSSGGVPSLSTALPASLTATNMSLTTPTLGVAAATSINFGGSALNTYAANTSWTPAMTFATPGDLTVAYTTQSGTYSRIGNIVCLTFVLAFAPTFTTASGAFQITGLPFTIGSSCVGTTQYQASTFPVGTTYIYLRATAGNTFLTINGSGSATSTAAMSTTQVTTGGNVTMLGTITYLV